MTIEIISGSPREKSVSYRVALFLQDYLRQHTDHLVNIIDVRDWPLPLLQSVWKTADEAPEEFRPLARRMFAADAFIMLSPEYNGSYTPALKNLFDQFPKQAHKSFGIVTASPGAMGGMRASQQMQLLTAALFGILAPNMLIIPGVDKKFDEEGNLTDASFEKAVDAFFKEFLWLAERLAANRRSEIPTP